MEKESMKTYHSNLDALKEHCPDIYKTISEMDNTPDSRTIKLKPDADLPDIILENQSNNIFYYGSDDPLKYCRDYIKSLDLHYAPVLVFLGFGLGYQVAVTLNHFAKKMNIQHIIIVEKDIKLFQTALMTLDFTGMIRHPNIEIVVGIDSDNLFKAFTKYLMKTPEVSHFFRNLKIICMPSVQIVYSEYYQKAFESLKLSVMNNLHHFGNDPYDSIRGIDITLSNIKPMVEDPGILSFKDCMKGKPAIVIGAGPSLNKSMKYLKEASHKALLISVDAALKPLLEAGVRPHMVTGIESVIGGDEFYSNLGKLDDIFLVFCSVLRSEDYRAYNGPKIFAHRYQEIANWIGIETGSLAGGPLVGNFAFSIAQYLGCDPIILIGQDLSFPPTGATHVDGMVYGVLEEYRSSMIAFETEGYSGEPLLTNLYFEESRRSLELDLEKHDALYINASEGGAKIHGAMFLNLKTAIEQYCHDSWNTREYLQTIWAKEKKEKESTKKEESQKVMISLQKTVSRLEALLKACKQGLSIIADFENRYDPLTNRKPNPEAIAKVQEEHNKLINIRGQIRSNPKLRFLAYTYSCYNTDFLMRRNFQFDRFNNRSYALLKSFLMEKEYFSVMGQLLLSTVYLIKDAQVRLNR